MLQPLNARRARWGLPIIVALYLMLGTLYAVYTPPWQAPDEPAHYNYVRFMAEHLRFPVLKLGDYPAAYLEAIKAAHFPPQMSIEPIRYEFHQPPLYYVLAAPIYLLFRGSLLPLRLFSVALGALLLLTVNGAVRELAPQQPFLALGATAFVAFLPMHLAMTAAANNDPLAELLLALVLLLSIRYLKAPAGRQEPGSLDRHAEGLAATESRVQQKAGRLLLLLGIITGLGFVTKSSVYVAAPLVLLAIAARHLWLDPEPPAWSGSAKAVLSYLLPAVAVGCLWWLRNSVVYGGLDILGLGRHEQVVAGQLRTSEFIAQHGTGALVHDLLLTSFRSFWGQFGWMGVLLDERLYQTLAIVSAVALVGFLAWAKGAWQRRAEFARWQWAAGTLLALSVLFSLASYLWYNSRFVQHQGRYLFSALLPIGLAFALGWREALRRERALLMAGLALAAAVGLFLILRGALSTWLLMMLLAVGAAFAVRRFLPSACDRLVQLCPYLLLPLLDLACLFLFVVPQLAR